MTLTTDRLILRPFTPDDLGALVAIHRDPETNAFLPWFPVRTLADARRFFDERYAQGAGLRLALCPKREGEPVGYVHVGAQEPYDLGYGLRRNRWGPGSPPRPPKPCWPTSAPSTTPTSPPPTTSGIPAAGP